MQAVSVQCNPRLQIQSEGPIVLRQRASKERKSEGGRGRKRKREGEKEGGREGARERGAREREGREGKEGGRARGLGRRKVEGRTGKGSSQKKGRWKGAAESPSRKGASETAERKAPQGFLSLKRATWLASTCTRVPTDLIYLRVGTATIFFFPSNYCIPSLHENGVPRVNTGSASFL